jgi:hypothetical protein
MRSSSGRSLESQEDAQIGDAVRASNLSDAILASSGRFNLRSNAI